MFACVKKRKQMHIEFRHMTHDSSGFTKTASNQLKDGALTTAGYLQHTGHASHL
jgi:hypothetical protein